MKATSNRIVLFNIINIAVIQGLTFFTIPIISRLLGVENYGIVTIYMTWISLVTVVFGLQTQSTIAVSRIEFSLQEQKKYQSSIMVLSFLTYMFFSFITIIFIKPLSGVLYTEPIILIVMLLHSFGQFSIGFINVKNIYEFKAGKNLLINVCVFLITTTLSIYFINLMPDNKNFLGRIYGLAIPYFSFGLIVFIAIIVKGKTFFNKKYWLFCIQLSFPVVIHNIAGIFLNQSDRVMLQRILGNSTAGIYGLACSFSAILITIYIALNNSWVPYFYKYMENGDKEKIKKHAKNYMELFTIIVVSFLMLSKEVFHVFAGKDFWTGTQYIIVFAIGNYFIFLYSFPVNYEFFKKKTKYIAIGTSCSAVLNIILNFILINKIGILGAVIATAIAQGLQFIFHHLSAKNILNKNNGDYPFDFKTYMVYFFIFLMGVSLTLLLYKATYMRWGIGILIGLFEVYRIYIRKAVI